MMIEPLRIKEYNQPQGVNHESTTRQSYSPEFQAEAIKLVLEQQQSIASVSRNLKISH